MFQMADEFRELGIIVEEVSSALLKSKAVSFVKVMPELCNFQDECMVTKQAYDQLKKEMESVIEDNIRQDGVIRDLKKNIEDISSLKEPRKSMIIDFID